MIWVHPCSVELDRRTARYVKLRYRARNTDPALGSYLLYVDEGAGSNMTADKLVLRAGDLVHDGDWHTAVAIITGKGKLRRFALRFRALPGTEGSLEVAELRFSKDPPRFRIADAAPWAPAEATARALPLGALLDCDLAKLQKALSLADWFTTRRVTMAGAIFEVALDGLVAKSTPYKGGGGFEVPVGLAAAELHLLIGAQFRGKLLSYKNLENEDRVWRPTQFVLTVTYADGTVDEQIPYCLGKRKYGVWRGLHAYAVRTDGNRTINAVSMRDGMTIAGAFHLAALTASDQALTPTRPDLARPTPPGAAAPPTPPSLVRQDERLIAGNDGGRFEFRLDRGLAVSALRNARHPEWGVTAASTPLFAVREATRRWSADRFAVQDCALTGAGATVELASDEARAAVTVKLAAIGGGEVRLNASLTNLAAEDRRLGLVFPTVRFAKPSGPDDLWYVYPRLAVAWSNADRRLKEPHNGQFPVQWMDVYDRAAGGGVSLMTRDVEGNCRWYELAKAKGQVEMAVEYWDVLLPAGDTRSYPPAYVGLHGGDWRSVHRRYCDWVRSWCKPLAPRLEWFRRVWNFRTQWTHTLRDGDPRWNWFRRWEQA